MVASHTIYDHKRLMHLLQLELSDPSLWQDGCHWRKHGLESGHCECKKRCQLWKHPSSKHQSWQWQAKIISGKLQSPVAFLFNCTKKIINIRTENSFRNICNLDITSQANAKRGKRFGPRLSVANALGSSFRHFRWSNSVWETNALFLPRQKSLKNDHAFNKLWFQVTKACAICYKPNNNSFTPVVGLHGSDLWEEMACHLSHLQGSAIRAKYIHS